MHHAPRIAAVAVLAVALGLLAPGASAPAAAQTCPPPGGADVGWPQPSSSGDFHLLARGSGHGVGMSQHGAHGAALLGCSTAQILAAYYPGTTLQTAGDRSISVGLFRGTPTSPLPSITFVEAEQGPVTWRFNGSPLPATQPHGETWTIQASGRRLRVSSGGSLVWEAPSDDGRLEADLDASEATRVKLPTKANRVYNRGRLRFEVESAGRMYVTVVLASIEHYLYGLWEVPSSWHVEALKAQAIAGRSYAHLRTSTQDSCGCQIHDSVVDQAYRAYDKEGEPGWGHRWVEAVDGTGRQVLTHDGEVASTYYSASHGGQSERLGFSSFFGGSDLPYLVPVDDSRWELASTSAQSGTLRWSASYSREQISQRLQSHGVGAVQSIHVRPPTGAGGRVGHPGRTASGTSSRYGGVEVVGTQGSVTLSGLQFMQALGTPRRTELFRVETGEAFQCLPSTDQSSNQTVRRASGPDRVATAAAVSAQYWDEAPEVVLATSISFPDALSAGVLAARLGAPILLTRGSLLDDVARAELERLGAERVYLMGGTAALSARVEQEVTDAGFEVERVSGSNRFATASAAALAAGPSPSGEVALAYGGDWPDAVSAGALSGSPDRVPTLLSERDSVPGESLDALEGLGAGKVLLIGGTAVLTQAVADQLESEGYVVGRLSGPSRYQTSVAVAADAAARLRDARPVVMATGQAFPDALSAGGLVARLGAGLVLTTRCGLGSIPETLEHLREGPYDSGVIVGGTAAVSDLVREQATDAIER